MTRAVPGFAPGPPTFTFLHLHIPIFCSQHIYPLLSLTTRSVPFHTPLRSLSTPRSLATHFPYPHISSHSFHVPPILPSIIFYHTHLLYKPSSPSHHNPTTTHPIHLRPNSSLYHPSIRRCPLTPRFLSSLHPSRAGDHIKNFNIIEKYIKKKEFTIISCLYLNNNYAGQVLCSVSNRESIR